MRNKVISYLFENQVLGAIFVLAIAWLVIQIRDVLITLFISYILMAAITPYVKYLQKRRVPRPIAVVVPYIIAIVVITLLIITLVPFFIAQVNLLLSTFPSYLNQDFHLFGTTIEASDINGLASTELQSLGRSAFAVTTAVFGGVVSAISVFAISFYLLLYRDAVTSSFVSIFPKKHQEKVAKTTGLVEDKLGSWLRGQLVLSLFIGITSWVVLTILGVEFALPLAVIAGLFEIVPTIGPIISGIPAVIVAFNSSPLLGLIVAAAYFLIQLFENNVLVPRVMQRAVGLNPIVIIIGIIVGGKLLGLAGALLAIPFISLLVVVYKNIE